jgi:hypothetical protein
LSCGACVLGTLGIEGDGNSICYNTTTTTSDGNGDSFNMLVSRTPQTCTSDCSGNGICYAVDATTGQPLPTSEICYYDSPCSMKCKCNDGYVGTICGRTVEDTQKVKKQLTTLVDKFHDTLSFSDNSEQVCIMCTECYPVVFTTNEILI